jgi:hypothetical protein
MIIAMSLKYTKEFQIKHNPILEVYQRVPITWNADYKTFISPREL